MSLKTSLFFLSLIIPNKKPEWTKKVTRVSKQKTNKKWTIKKGQTNAFFHASLCHFFSFCCLQKNILLFASSSSNDKHIIVKKRERILVVTQTQNIMSSSSSSSPVFFFANARQRMRSRDSCCASLSSSSSSAKPSSSFLSGGGGRRKRRFAPPALRRNAAKNTNERMMTRRRSKDDFNNADYYYYYYRDFSATTRRKRTTTTTTLPTRRRAFVFSSGNNKRGRRSRIANAAADANGGSTNVFEEMSSIRTRKYYLVGGKGGVGKTSLSASLAVKFATSGQHPTLIVSTDPAHSLSDSLAQDVSSGVPVAVEGTDGMLWAMEIDTSQAKSEFSEFSKSADFTKGASDFMGSVGLSGISDSLQDLKLGELLDTPPPGLDEAIAIAKVVQFTKDEKYAKFTRIVFDTAPTGHTLRLLSLPEFLDKSIGKIVRLRQKLTSAGDMVKGLFGQENQNQDAAVEKLENLKKRLQEVKDLFRNKETTEFVIATIPTVLGMSESGRLLKSLRDETVPCTKIVINQILNVDVADFQDAADACNAAAEKLKTSTDETSKDADVQTLISESERLASASKRAVSFVRMKEKDQRKAMEMLDTDAGLKTLKRIEAPMFDLEIRGVPALKYFGDQVW